MKQIKCSADNELGIEYLRGDLKFRCWSVVYCGVHWPLQIVFVWFNNLYRTFRHYILFWLHIIHFDGMQITAAVGHTIKSFTQCYDTYTQRHSSMHRIIYMDTEFTWIFTRTPPTPIVVRTSTYLRALKWTGNIVLSDTFVSFVILMFFF